MFNKCVCLLCLLNKIKCNPYNIYNIYYIKLLKRLIDKAYKKTLCLRAIQNLSGSYYKSGPFSFSSHMNEVHIYAS